MFIKEYANAVQKARSLEFHISINMLPILISIYFLAILVLGPACLDCLQTESMFRQ